jgi:hypothetical protein
MITYDKNPALDTSNIRIVVAKKEISRKKR